MTETETIGDTRVWRYRIGLDGKIEGRIFASPEDIPEDENWQDTPAGLVETAPRGRGRRRRSDSSGEDTPPASDDNSEGSD